MRIILAADIFPPDIGGPATYSKNLATELIKNGHDVQLICYGDKFNQYEDDGGYKVIKIGRDKPLLLRYFDYFSNLLKVGKKSRFNLFYGTGFGWTSHYVSR